jgi:hypothetical protein
MKSYCKPHIELLNFSADDILTISPTTENGRDNVWNDDYNY